MINKMMNFQCSRQAPTCAPFLSHSRTLASFVHCLFPAQMNSSCLLTFPMSSLLPNNRVYYKYHGSMVIPPCHESITWVVFAQPLYITPDQVSLWMCYLPEFNIISTGSRNDDVSNVVVGLCQWDITVKLTKRSTIIICRQNVHDETFSMK